MEMNHQKIINIGISGSYGGTNLGDEAILQSMINQIKETGPCHITIFTQNTEDTLIRHKIDRAIMAKKLSRREVTEEIKKLDLFILGGGGILYDSAVSYYLREVEIANEVGIPVFIYAISAGPLTKTSSKKIVANTLNEVRVITVRDLYGKHLLEEVGVSKEIHITADPAVLLGPEPLPKDALLQEGLMSKKRLIGLSVREPGPAAPDMDIDHYHSLLADVADFLVERIGVHVVFVPMERNHKDLQQSHAVISKMFNAQNASVLQHEYTSGQIIAWMNHFEFAIGMRLHFLIFAAIMGVPFIPLPYAGKVQGFIESLGLQMPPLSEVTSGRLLAHVDASWDSRIDLSQKIKDAFPKVQAQARLTHHHLFSLINNLRKRNRYDGLKAA